MTQEKNDLGDRTDWPWVCTHSLKASKCSLEENLLSSSQKAQVSEIEPRAPTGRLALLQRNFEFQPQRMPMVKARTQNGKE